MKARKAVEEKLLSAASSGESAKLSKLLLKASLQPLSLTSLSLDSFHATSLHAALCEAARNGHTECARQLIEARADVTLPSSDGESTPLHLASQLGNADIITLLLDAGAPVASQRIRTSSSAEELGKSRLSSSSSLLSPLHLAAKAGHPSCVEKLLSAGASSDAASTKGYTPLHLACVTGCAACARLLLRAGASVDARTLRGYTPLHFACQSGRTSCVQCLLESGASPSSHTGRRCTPLHVACRAGHADCVQLLLSSLPEREATKALLHCFNSDEDTALMLAADNGHVACVALLIGAGAEVNMKQGSGYPLFMATAKGHSECVRLLVEAGELHIFSAPLPHPSTLLSILPLNFSCSR